MDQDVQALRSARAHLLLYMLRCIVHCIGPAYMAVDAYMTLYSGWCQEAACPGVQHILPLLSHGSGNLPGSANQGILGSCF